MWSQRPRLAGHAVNQRLALLYGLYVAMAVFILTLQVPYRSASFVILGGIGLIACIVVTRRVAHCPVCGKDTRRYPVKPAGFSPIRFTNINWFAPERCPHCNSDLLENGRDGRSGD
jgi:hypothetical protein